MSRYFLDGETFVPDFEKCHLCHREEERKSECVCEKETERERERVSKERKMEMKRKRYKSCLLLERVINNKEREREKGTERKEEIMKKTYF